MHVEIKHSCLVCDKDFIKKPLSFENAVALFLGHPVHFDLDIDLAQLASVQSRFFSTCLLCLLSAYVLCLMNFCRT